MLAFLLSFVALAACGGTVAGLLERRIAAARVAVPVARPASRP
jgi:hypothetical protein